MKEAKANGETQPHIKNIVSENIDGCAPIYLEEKPSPKEFSIIRLVGTGNFSEVFHVERALSPIEKSRQIERKRMGKSYVTDGVLDFAMKRIDKQKLKRLGKEAEIIMEKHCLRKLNDLTKINVYGWNNILKLHWTTQDETSLYLISEYHPTSGELWDLVAGIGVMDLDLGRYYAAQLVNAVEYIHSLGIIHRDLKAENILIASDGTLKLIDFGSAIDITRPDLKSAGNRSSGRSAKSFQNFVGTAQFMPPEALKNQPSGRAFDLWSLGATFYQLFAGSPPFEAPSDFLVHLRSSNVELDRPPHFPADLFDLISRLLQITPEERLCFYDTDLRAIKSHQFFSGVDFSHPRALLAEGRLPWPPLRDLCISHMARNWDRFKEKLHAAGWLKLHGSDSTTIEQNPVEAMALGNMRHALTVFEKPSKPIDLEVQSRSLLAIPHANADEQIHRGVERMLFWKNLTASRQEEYWQEKVQRFLAETSDKQQSQQESDDSSVTENSVNSATEREQKKGGGDVVLTRNGS